MDKTTEELIASDDDQPSNPPFADRAAKLSCYLALALYFFGVLSTRSPLAWMLFMGMDAVALGLGVFGIIGGAVHGNRATVWMAALGLLLSGIPPVVLALVALGAR